MMIIIIIKIFDQDKNIILVKVNISKKEKGTTVHSGIVTS